MTRRWRGWLTRFLAYQWCRWMLASSKGRYSSFAASIGEIPGIFPACNRSINGLLRWEGKFCTLEPTALIVEGRTHDGVNLLRMDAA